MEGARWLKFGAQSRSRWLTSTIAELCAFLVSFLYSRYDAFSARGVAQAQSFANKMHPSINALPRYLNDFSWKEMMIAVQGHALRYRRR